MGTWTETTLDAIPLAVITLTPVHGPGGAVVDFAYVWANTQACSYTGMAREDLIGARLLEVFPGLADAGLLAACAEVFETGVPLLLTDTVYVNERRGGASLRYDVRAVRTHGALVLSWQDVTDRYLARASLLAAATTDALTGLTSRAEGMALLARALDETGPGTTHGVAFLDIDGLKTVNDGHGHASGDALLISTAVRIRACVRADDVVIRHGGDEIVLVLHGVGSIEAATAVCEKVRAALAAPITIHDEPITTTASIGLVMAGPGEPAASVLERADAAMYRAKALGGNRVSVG